MKKHYTESGDAWLMGMGKSGFKGATSDKRYIQILKYISDNDGCTKMDVLQGIGSNKFGRGQYSDIFSALKIAGLIDYDRQNNEYHITDKGNEVLENSYLNDMERTVTGRKKFESTQRKTNMKKLNITKEQFNRSRYFQRKYGELEYVSESGKIFKTDKGKVLMFKEAFNIDDYADMSEEDKPKFDIGEHVVLTDEFFLGSDSTMQEFPRTGWMIEDVRECEYDTDGHGKFEYYVVHDNPFRKKIMDDDTDYSGGWWVLEYEIDKEKSSERMWSESGKKFNESDDEIGDAVQDAYDKYRACRTEPKICHAVKINSDGTEEKVGISMTRGNSIGGIVKAIRDGRLRKVLKFSESSRKFAKESSGTEWLNSFKKAQDFVDRACKQLEVVAFEGGAEVGNPIHKKLLRIWDEMRDVIGSI